MIINFLWGFHHPGPNFCTWCTPPPFKEEHNPIQHLHFLIGQKCWSIRKCIKRGKIKFFYFSPIFWEWMQPSLARKLPKGNACTRLRCKNLKIPDLFNIFQHISTNLVYIAWLVLPLITPLLDPTELPVIGWKKVMKTDSPYSNLPPFHKLWTNHGQIDVHIIIWCELQYTLL